MPSHLGKTLLIANPAAQRGSGAQAAQVARELLAEWLGESALSFELTQRPRHATQLAANAAQEHFDTVIALGGDGAVHEVVNGLMRIPADARPRLGVIPVGSGNDYARTLGMSESVPDAIVQLIDAAERPVDIGRCNDTYFDETLSFGLDAAIALDTVQRRKRTGEQGGMLYLKSGLDQLLHHLEAYELHAILHGGSAIGQGAGGADARVLRGSIHLLAVQVGPTYGGGFRICPNADISDGLLDLCYADAPMRTLPAAVRFLSAKNAHHTHWRHIHFDRASRIDLSFDRRPPCQVDGEPLVADTYTIRVCPSALRVLMPR